MFRLSENRNHSSILGRNKVNSEHGNCCERDVLEACFSANLKVQDCQRVTVRDPSCKKYHSGIFSGGWLEPLGTSADDLSCVFVAGGSWASTKSQEVLPTMTSSACKQLPLRKHGFFALKSV